MQHIGQRNHVEAAAFDHIQPVDFVAIKDKIQIIQIEHVACNHVRKKLLQGRGAASYFENRQSRRIGKILELIPIKFAIPEKEVLVGAEPDAIALGRSAIFYLFALRNRNRAAHLSARM